MAAHLEDPRRTAQQGTTMVGQPADSHRVVQHWVIMVVHPVDPRRVAQQVTIMADQPADSHRTLQQAATLAGHRKAFQLETVMEDQQEAAKTPLLQVLKSTASPLLLAMDPHQTKEAFLSLHPHPTVLQAPTTTITTLPLSLPHHLTEVHQLDSLTLPNQPNHPTEARQSLVAI